MKKEVSCRVMMSVLEYARERNIRPEELCTGIPYTLTHLRNKHERVGWDDYCRLMANARNYWDDADFEAFGRWVTRTLPFRSSLIAGRLLFTGMEFYEWLNSNTHGGGAHLFTCVMSSMRRAGPNRLLVTLTFPAGYPYNHEFFLITRGTLSEASTLLGLPPARVSLRQLEGGATLDIQCPEGGGVLSWLRRTLTWPFTARSAANELQEANDALRERYSQLEETREVLERQATRLKVAYDISQLIHANLDLDSTLQAILRSLIDVAGFAAVSISLNAHAGKEETRRSVRAGEDSRTSPHITRVLEGRGEGLGEISLWVPAGTNMQNAGELLDYVVPTIAMEIEETLSFTLINEYRQFLEQKVEDRTRELKETNESLKRAQAGRDRLFSNISHEFRTPLTLILGPLERIIDQSKGGKERGRFTLMKRNAEKLLDLINQLLDLSRLQSGDLRLRAAEIDLISFMRALVMSYRSLADTRKIKLTFRATCRSLPIHLDREKAATLFNNLLVNAFKFTPERGRIDVVAEESAGSAHVRIRDSGSGIPETELPHIFDRFYQGSSTGVHAVGGTGIGLALTKELADLHHGTVRVSSTVGSGTEFVVTLPLGTAHLSPKERAAPAAESRQGKADPVPIRSGEPALLPSAVLDGSKRIVLVVDDDPDVRQYVKEILAAEMQVIEARDGEEGIRQAQTWMPDLVISDVMMPGRDGNELCRILKEDVRTSHIPVILLTAKAGVENRIEGLETGADDYVVKPFVARELVVRARNLIALREALRKRFGAGSLLKPGERHPSSMEHVFLQRAMETVDRHMNDDGFGIDDFSREMGLSRAQLHRKLVALTDCSARDFLRRIRLERGRDLLQNNAGTVSEVAYQVGFRDSSHFAKCFRQQFGVPPGSVRPTSGPVRLTP